METFGIELSLIQQLFPKRSRKTLKAKFTREEKTNRARMNAAVETARQQPPEVQACSDTRHSSSWDTFPTLPTARCFSDVEGQM